MKEIKIAKIADILLEIGWLSILILLPLVFFPFFISGAWQISEYFVFQIITEMMFFIWLVKIILFGKSVCRSEISLVKSVKILLPAGIFIFILGLSTIFSQSPHYSFWGIYYRKMGYLTWLHFFIFFLILFFNLKNKEQIKRIFWAVIFTVFVATIYGLTQIIGLDFLTWNEPTGFISRVFSTFGQPNFFASWLLLALPIVFLTFFQLSKTSFIKRPVLICLIILTLIVFIFTQSRAGWLGFLIAFSFFILIFTRLKKKKKVFFSFLFFLFAGFLMIFVLNLKPLTVNSDDNFLIARFKTLTDLSDAGGIRFFWWDKSLDLIKIKPVLGYGPETQKFNFARYYGPDAAAMEAINSIPDRAHNDFLDILLTSGILGLLSYLFLLISVFYFGLKYVFKKVKTELEISSLSAPGGGRGKLETLVLLAGLTGYLFSLQFSFHVIPTAVYFWVYLAIVLRLSAGTEDNAETNINPPPSPPSASRRRRMAEAEAKLRRFSSKRGHKARSRLRDNFKFLIPRHTWDYPESAEWVIFKSINFKFFIGFKIDSLKIQ